MDILQTIESVSGSNFRKKASTHGGEYSGPCPWCGGDDRFSIHPTNDHYVCRKCKRAGDAIKFMMDFAGKTYKESCTALGVAMKYNSRYDHQTAAVKKWAPRQDTMPDTAWQEKASAYLFQCFKFLMSSNQTAQTHRRWLNERGISNDLIKTARLGWNSRSISFDRESWGLAPEKDKNGKNKQIWIPEGLIIPCFTYGKLARLRIRQENPKTTDRFLMVAGSSMDYLYHGGQKIPDKKKPTAVAVVEAELDGWVLYDQALKAGFHLQVFSIGNSSTRPNEAAHKVISSAPKVYIVLDLDEAGDTETIWWRNNYIRSVDVRPAGLEHGKDPGEWAKNGFDFSGWFYKISNPTKSHQKESAAGNDIEIESFFESVEITEVETPPFTTQKNDEIEDVVLKMQHDEDLRKLNRCCIHGHYCISAKENICLRTKENIFKMPECPVGQWYCIEDGMVKQIILGMRFRKR